MADSQSASDSLPADAQTVHLLVLIHGMWGNPGHLAEMKRIITETRIDAQDAEKGPEGEELHVLVAETNRDDGTYDGIDWGGERVAEEIYAEIKELKEKGKKVTRFSITGYSLGGLIARYVVGILHQRKFFDDVTPVNFNTIATPHVGLPRYPTWVSSIFAFFGPKLLSRTGEQFYAMDKWSAHDRPLLEVMADPNRVFFQTFASFQNKRIYANAVNDMTVPYPTAAISVSDPFSKQKLDLVDVTYEEGYEPVIKSYTLPAPQKVAALPPKPLMFSRQWFASLKLRRIEPPLPPALQFDFPLNLVLLVVTPILMPIIITLILSRLGLANFSSRKRISRLERDESGTAKLIHIIGRLEREMEDAVVDMFDDAEAGRTPTTTSALVGPSRAAAATTTPPAATTTAAPSTPSEQSTVDLPEHPAEGLLLSGVQRQCVEWLDTLPGLQKQLVWIHPTRNSHGTIIARDVKHFSFHELGRGVIRHWTDQFVM